MVTKGFTKIDNCILLDSDLSLEAKGLYAMIKHLSTIPNFKIARDYVKKISGYGETAFRRVWKELKEARLLLENKLRDKGKYVYQYTLKNDETETKTKALVKGTEHKYLDSDGNVPIQGQVNIDDVLVEKQKEVPGIDENVAVVSEATGFTNLEAIKLLKEAENNVTKVMESYVYVKAQKNIKNLFNYTKWVIKNGIVNQHINGSVNNKVSTFNNFKHREYDFDRLEKALLYGEQYELPA
jgi:hypothetical protein